MLLFGIIIGICLAAGDMAAKDILKRQHENDSKMMERLKVPGYSLIHIIFVNLGLSDFLNGLFNKGKDDGNTRGKDSTS